MAIGKLSETCGSAFCLAYFGRRVPERAAFQRDRQRQVYAPHFTRHFVRKCRERSPVALENASGRANLFPIGLHFIPIPGKKLRRIVPL